MSQRITRGKALIGSGGITVVGDATATVNPAALAPDTGESLDVAVTNAALGDFVMIAAPYDLADVTANAYVSAAGTVTVSVWNTGSGTPNLASGTWKIKVLR